MNPIRTLHKKSKVGLVNLVKFDHVNQLITLSLITLSSTHWNCCNQIYQIKSSVFSASYYISFLLLIIIKYFGIIFIQTHFYTLVQLKHRPNLFQLFLLWTLQIHPITNVNSQITFGSKTSKIFFREQKRKNSSNIILRYKKIRNVDYKIFFRKF